MTTTRPWARLASLARRAGSTPRLIRERRTITPGSIAMTRSVSHSPNPSHSGGQLLLNLTHPTRLTPVDSYSFFMPWAASWRRGAARSAARDHHNGRVASYLAPRQNDGQGAAVDLAERWAPVSPASRMEPLARERHLA